MNNFENQLKHYPVEKGNYVLFFELQKIVTIKVGALGYVTFPVGTYAYAGSALGPGGIRARLKHHLKPSPKPHWHLDYLKPYVFWLQVGWKVTNERLECVWAQSLLKQGGQVPVARFGASDCQQGCTAHLIQLPESPLTALKTLDIKERFDFKYNKANF